MPERYLYDDAAGSRPGEETLLEYGRRINRVIDYINANLHLSPTLDELAAVAPFSKFHFHRIFKNYVGETVSGFMRRLRMERAAHVLVYERGLPITEVAMRYGFSSSQNFSKAFKLHFGMSPSAFRETLDFRRPETWDMLPLTGNSKPGNTNGNPGQDNAPAAGHNVGPEGGQKSFREVASKVRIIRLEDMHVAYCRSIGPYTDENIEPLFNRLGAWAAANGLDGPEARLVGVPWDNPEITPGALCRYDLCLAVPPGVRAGGDVGLQDLEGGLVAAYRQEVSSADDVDQAWDDLFRYWLPQSGFVVDDRQFVDLYVKLPEQGSGDKWVADFCLPVKPL